MIFPFTPKEERVLGRKARRWWLTPVLALQVLLTACDSDADVEVLPLPPLERPSPEARAGLPEVHGTWRFAGWEVIRGDSTALERTFPSFGDIRLDVQRLDSLAGSFATAGGAAEVVGEVRRDGWVALVTLRGGVPAEFITGRYARDTLWLELTSVMAPDEWPRDARAAFVRDQPSGPLAWIRGVPRVDPRAAAIDSARVAAGAPADSSAGALSPDEPIEQPAASRMGGANDADGGPPGIPGDAPGPGPTPTPPSTRSPVPPPPPPPPPARPPLVGEEQEPSGEQVQEPEEQAPANDEVEEEGAPSLLGTPIDPPDR